MFHVLANACITFALHLHYICIALLNMSKDKQALVSIVKRWLNIGEIRRGKHTDTKARARVYIARI